MTETATTTETETKAPLPDIPPVELKRGDSVITVNIQEETKGKGNGSFFMGLPPESPLTVAQLTTLMGEDFIARKLNNILKGALKDCYKETITSPTDEKVEVPFDSARFQSLWSEWQFVSESISALKGRQEAVMYKMLEIPEDGSDKSRNDRIALVGQLKAIKLAIERKSRKKTDDEGED